LQNNPGGTTPIFTHGVDIMTDSFGSRGNFTVANHNYTIWRLAAIASRYPQVNRLPFSLRVLLENLLRTEDGLNVRAEEIAALAQWDPKAVPSREIAFTPSRVLLQDFTGVPAVVDLAAMRDAMKRMGGDPKKINPLQPVELVIDHSVQVDHFGTALAFKNNADIEFTRNRERYQFLRWGQRAFDNFRVVPPETGIVHQVNLEYLARVVFVDESKKRHDGTPNMYPDTLVGTDSHTTMVNGLGVLGWGVGGIEAEAAMLGQPVSMLIPQVVGFKLYGKLAEGATATDLVLTVTQMLRARGVVGKFVEFYGAGLASLPLADRATIANMSPEYGATCGIFPIDAETLRYLRLTGRPEEHVRRVEAYAKEQGLFHTAQTPEAVYSEALELDLGTVEPSLAGPSRPQDRVALKDVKKSFATVLPSLVRKGSTSGGQAEIKIGADTHTLRHGSVVIAAITSCTNTSNPSVLIGAGILAKKAVERGLHTKPWVKTSLAPGSKAVTEYLARAGLARYLEQLRFFLVGYGCTTCIGNSGPLPPAIAKGIADNDLVVAAVLSGNRNFEGRIHPDVRANYLASPPLVVAYALAGRMDLDLASEPLGMDPHGKPVYLHDIWPTQKEVNDVIDQCVQPEMYAAVYKNVFQGEEHWNALQVPAGDQFTWDSSSTYVKHPPYFDDMPVSAPPVRDITGARVLAYLGDSITTDHISPAGSIKEKSAAGQYLISRGVQPADFNSYGARRGNDEVMVRGTFANVRLKNKLAPGTEGGVTRHLPDGGQSTIFDAAMKYKAEGVPLIILAGKEYGSGSSRDWAAKGPRLLGVRAVIAESFERIHRSNLVGMGILPLQFLPGENADKLGLTGEEVYDIVGLADILKNLKSGREVTVKAGDKSFRALVRIDTPQEVHYYQHGGILQFVLRQLLKGS
jgi:aconitate hydratase